MASGRRPAGRTQELLLSLLRQAQHPLTGLALTELLRIQGEAVAPSLVFRALRGLVDQGAVRKLLSARGYVAAESGDELYLCCRSCGSVTALADAAPFVAIAQAAQVAGFRVGSPLVEIIGRCACCTAAEGTCDGAR